MPQFIKNWSLSTKIMALVVNLFIIIGMGNVLLVNQGTNQLVQETSRERIQDETRLLSTRFDEIEGELLEAARFIATRTQIGELVAQKEANALLPVVLSLVAPLDLDDADIIDQDNTSLFDLMNNFTSENSPDDDLTALSQLGIETTGLILDPDSGLQLAASVPLRDQQGQIVGVIYV
ncbi:MAG: hypothetical protein K8I82_17940, partial [Anaerolineae bacterium]|nr:hypothetical protein [Anaerolineae bacterium]